VVRKGKPFSRPFRPRPVKEAFSRRTNHQFTLVVLIILAWRSLGEEGDTWRLSIESWNTGMSDSEMRICRESRLTGSPHPNPLGIESNPIRFLPTGEGAPSKLRGLGEFLLGGQGGIISPCGFGQSPRFSHASAWFGG